ncbi:uncharacterized protein LOC130800394 [Amaranthus tricolor]|uniref:uncharacterized protein LOC130800394 n=1 Tax=Amaranthus tricolor TaxID=29722 RepID=UPI0025845DB2|nr:uncharacterized protein LOC130800394 [Amaranthus tricolor]
MEHQNESELVGESVQDKDENSNSEDRRRSSSISSVSDIESAITDFSLDDSTQLDRNDHGSLASDQDQDDDNDDGLEMPSGDAAALEFPTVQVMERPADDSGYRIPSYVFASNKSSNPEWSLASNESLFSIPAGNMSFTRDQFSWLLKSGESGPCWSSDLPKSGELPPPSPRNAPKAADLRLDETMPLTKPEVIESGHESIAAPPYRSEKDVDFHGTSPPINETADFDSGVKKDGLIVDTKEKTSSVSGSEDSPLSKCISHRSDQSFAFPVLAEVGRDKSVNSGRSHTRAEHRKNSLVPETEAPKPSPKATTEAAPASKSWFSCFSCCCCCCC